jgi:hypothetical protein
MLKKSARNYNLKVWNEIHEDANDENLVRYEKTKDSSCSFLLIHLVFLGES